MILAVSGSHQTGKTTLVEALAASIPNHTAVPEPYWDLASAGESFAERPDMESFEQLLAASIESLSSCEENCIFDRCPYDMLAYGSIHPDSARFDLSPYLPAMQAALVRLDLIVFVPIEQPERIAAADNGPLRSEIDQELRCLVVEDYLSFKVAAIEVTGSLPERVQTVLDHLRRIEPPPNA